MEILKGKKTHFIGVLGSSMSALALWCDSLGAEVSGSDKAFNQEGAEKIKTRGYFYGGSRDEFVKNADIVVYSSAVSAEEPELAYARGINKTIYERGEFLGMLSSLCDKVIAVSGAHGKTTTTAMLAEIFIKSSRRATVHIGGVSNYLGSNFISDGKDFCITEACEYKHSFLHLFPDIAIILNIDYDHPDYYKSIEEVEGAFMTFCSNVKKGGIVLAPYCSIIHVNANSVGYEVVTFGTTVGCNVRAIDIIPVEGGYEYELEYMNESYGKIMIKSPLHCNVINSLPAIAAAIICGISLDEIKLALMTFCGTGRRYEILGSFNGAEIIADYAHHPKEISQVISEAKRRTSGKLYVIFEPHTYSRTAALIDSFAVCFNLADMVITLPTFSAREKLDERGDEKTLYSRISNENKLILNSYEETCEYIRNVINVGDKLLILGAGDVNKLGKMIVGAGDNKLGK